MKPTDVIALLIGAIALTSLLRGGPADSAHSQTPQLFSIAANAAQSSAFLEDNDLRGLCEEQRALTLRILRAIVEVGSEDGEDINQTIDRLNSDQREMLVALRKYTDTPVAKYNKAESETIRRQIGMRSCPEMSRIEQERLLAEAFKYNPAMIRVGKRFFPEMFQASDPG